MDFRSRAWPPKGKMMDQTLGQRIAYLRRERRMTQEELAEKLDVSPQAVSKWENDNACPDIMLLPKLAKLLSVSVDELLSGEKVQEVALLPEEERKNMDELMLRIRVLSHDGDRVKINLPFALIKVGIQIGMQLPQIGNNDALKNIDFMQILQLVESGVIGKLLEVETADGDTVEIVVE